LQDNTSEQDVSCFEAEAQVGRTSNATFDRVLVVQGRQLMNALRQFFSTFVRPRPDKFFFHKTRVQSQQIYSSVPFQFFLNSYIKLTQVLIINYGVITKSVSTLMYTVWLVDKYKITFKIVINHWTNEIL